MRLSLSLAADQQFRRWRLLRLLLSF